MRRTPLALILSLATGAAACGGSGGGDTAGPPRSWTEAELVRTVRLQRASDLTYHLTAHPSCVATNLLRSTAEVQTYVSSGDVIVTNPDKSAGVKVNGQSAACRRLFTQAFARVR